ncbi:hypothetical protein [Streptomyces sp. CC219B]|uniref:hypothetical protein n=1 Tax=Streptomyces sp. CC219B TaxID=3044574 RepID=UPI0024A84A06|nr:hypothetical protein [Streptomyces sp. CC219B]
MTRHTLKEKTPDHGPNCRIAGFVRKEAAAVSARSAGDSGHSRPRKVPSPPPSHTT